MKNLLFFLLFAFSCTSHNFEATGQNSAKRTVSGFDEISISGGFDKIILKEGASEGVEIESDGADLEKIITETNGNTLEIHTKRGYDPGNKKIKITVTFKKLREINNSGSSDIATESPIRGDEFEFNSSGSGDFSAEFDVRKLEVHISGSADMKLKGTADSQAYAISGSGDIDAQNLKGKDAEVAISGSGDVDLNVSGRVKSSVSGSGDVSNHN